MKGDAEWEAITNKVSGTEDAYKRLQVSCIIATLPDSASDPIVQQVGVGLVLPLAAASWRFGLSTAARVTGCPPSPSFTG